MDVGVSVGTVGVLVSGGSVGLAVGDAGSGFCVFVGSGVTQGVDVGVIVSPGFPTPGAVGSLLPGSGVSLGSGSIMGGVFVTSGIWGSWFLQPARESVNNTPNSSNAAVSRFFHFRLRRLMSSIGTASKPPGLAKAAAASGSTGFSPACDTKRPVCGS